ncbi:phosphatase 2C-like domain-containing protein [Cokeromyces recurvatus]|uniref:phosphatase 2C-like domain-containing protein n=1 Tax=Cokeromyces recurvatus TaxID=90255 RepID=UPI0022210D8D|nr:phosphatase 2C-like domain-containing protein [Cokeromyces recurvatus]KAI7907699.1 phosphatase 2C-like domain-containing protein [Cokeromyces recurvatus]
MRPYIQRIAIASLMLRSSRTLWTSSNYTRPALVYNLPSYIQQQILYLSDANNSNLIRNFSSTSSSPHIQIAPVSIIEDENENNTKKPGTNTASEKFQFIAYAAWHPKSRQNNKTTSSSSKRVPYWKENFKAGKVDAGEDAFFQTNTPEGLAIGVADGVGGWSLVGVDPALFSWTLMNNAAMIAKNEKSIPAQQILDTAFYELRKSGKVAAGSSTACILNLSKITGEMTTCNLGDSAFLLVRDKQIVYESPSQQHYFNCPYQLTVVPDSYPNRDELVTDLPKDADTKSFFLKDGDLILLATDGYFDNMYPEETLEIINENMKNIILNNSNDHELITATIRGLAKTLTDRARRLSLNPKRLSPWAKAAQAHGSNYRGGKVDDITCIVTLVCRKK